MMHGGVPRVALCAMAVACASAFQPSLPRNDRVLPSQSAWRYERNVLPNSSGNGLSIMNQSSNEEMHDGEDEYELVEFFVSPEQISMLRKEATKRDTRKKLAKFFLPPEESMEVSQETIDGIASLFDTSELIEVRGVSKDKKKHVHDTAYGLAATLEDDIGRPVVVVEIKGFAAKLYCPWDDEEKRGSNGEECIQLYSSYRPGQWTRKAKPVRDNRGQIIIDEETGKSVKEIPEY